MRIRSWRSSKGAALVEMVIVTPMLLLMVLGTADFGRALYTSIVLANAARAGAAYGAQSSGMASDKTAITAAARAEATDIGAITVSFPGNEPRSCGCPGGPDTAANCNDLSACPAVAPQTTSYGVPIVYVTVTASWSFTTIVNWPGIPSTVPLSYTAKMRLQ